MVMTSNLSAETRKSVGKGKSRALRREGKIPAIVYGNKKEPMAISINERDLNAELRKEGFFKIIVQRSMRQIMFFFLFSCKIYFVLTLW